METIENESLRKDVFQGVFTHQRRPIALRMAPMIDVVFLLLLFFLVAAKWRPAENFLPFQLPGGQSARQSVGKPEPLVIYIFATERGCQIQIGQLRSIQIEEENTEANLAALMEEMRLCLVTQKRVASDPIEIVCDPEVKWEHLAKIYNTFFGAGLTDITFAMTE